MIKINSRIYTQELEIPQVFFFALVNTHTNSNDPSPSPSMLEPGTVSMEERCLTIEIPKIRYGICCKFIAKLFENIIF